jgi:predicted HicB family RNase H-like nuclease
MCSSLSILIVPSYTKPGCKLQSPAEGKRREGLKAKRAVEDYLVTCKKLRRSPQRPYSGKVLLRIDPGLHTKAAMMAEAEGKSLNAWAQEALQRAIIGN